MHNGELAALLEGFFKKRLISQRRVSPHTIASYRDTFRLLLSFAQQRLKLAPSKMGLADLNAPFLTDFLESLERARSNKARTRNLRLTAIRSFLRFAALEAPEHSALIQRAVAIPNKRCARPLVDFLARPEIEALLDAVDRTTWIGRRDYALLLLAVQTGLRLSEITDLRHQDVTLGAGAHVHCMGKGRKERGTPLTKTATKILAAWLNEQSGASGLFLFPSLSGGRLSADAVQDLVGKHAAIARLKLSRVTLFPEDGYGFGHGVSGSEPKSPVRNVVKTERLSAGSYAGSGSRTASAGRCWSRSLGTNSIRMPQPA